MSDFLERWATRNPEMQSLIDRHTVAVDEKEDKMKVRDLMHELAKLDPDLEVVFQVDAEGNGYERPRGVEADELDDDDNHCTYLNIDPGETVAIIYP